MPVAELERLWHRLRPLAVEKMPLAVAPPRGSRFGSPLVLSRVHWVHPEMVVEVSYTEWTPDGLLRHVVYLGEREDKPASDVRRDPPPRGSRFGSPLVLSRVHWVRPEMVVEVSFAEWTPDGLLRHVVYLGEREDKRAIDVRRDPPEC